MGGALSRASAGAAGARTSAAWGAFRAAPHSRARAVRVVRRRPPRPRRAAPARVHELAEPALLLILRGHLLGAGDPGRAARGSAEPGRDRLACLARLDRARAPRGRLGTSAARA